jgi:hypothetical protein
MITANVIHRVFRIRCGNATGTAFAIDIDGKQYLTTARHVLNSGSGSSAVEIFTNGDWVPLTVRVVGHGLHDVDISVFATDRSLTPSELPMEASCAGLVYGQEVFFLGFPYGWVGKFRLTPDGYPLPFVKRATVSLLVGDVHYLDGHNNRGFSGGPVVFIQPGGCEFKVAGVISAFRAVEEPVYLQGEKTPLVYSYNTGIIIMHRIETAIDIIRKNPIGFELAPNPE